MDFENFVIISPPTSEPILKSMEIAPMPPMESTFDGKAIAWPLDPNGLYLLYEASSEHQRCCQIKAEASFGMGVSGAGAERMNALLPDGVGPASFCVDVGLDLEVYGNAFIEIVRSGAAIVGIRHLPARTMMRLKGGGYVQWVYEVDGDLVETPFRDEDVLMLSGISPAGLHYATPQWSGSHGMIELVQAATQYNTDFFNNNAIPSWAVIAKGGTLGKTAKESAKAFFQDEYRGFGKAHRALYMNTNTGTELEFKKLTEDRKDADFLKLMDAARERVITAHGVPPRMLGIVTPGQLGGGGEASGQMEIFDRITCQPRRRRVTEQLAPLGLGELAFERFSLTAENPETEDDNPKTGKTLTKADETALMAALLGAL